MFQKVESETKFSQIARQILAAIEKGEYKPVDRLPSEREIAEQMGVSRNAVREALKSLQVLEVVTARTGAGTFATDLAGSKSLRKDVLPILEESDDPADIIEAREAFELGLLRIAVANATSDDIQKLKRSLGEMREQAAVRNYVKYPKAGREFHINLAESSHNAVIGEIARILWETTNSRLSARLNESYAAENLDKSVEIHSLILEGMKKRDSRLTRQMIIIHYRELKDFLKV